MNYRKLKDLKKLPNNPRTIKTSDFDKLCKSIKDSPDYFEARPLILSDRTGELIIIAGNQRFEAAKTLKLKEVPTYLIKDLTEEREKEIIIRDNVSNGEWDMDLLANEWDQNDLEDWGLEISGLDEIKETKDIPDIGELEFSEELFLEHNYIVLYFDNVMDWEVAKEKYDIKNVKTNVPKGSQKIGVGRVINGSKFI